MFAKIGVNIKHVKTHRIGKKTDKKSNFSSNVCTFTSQTFPHEIMYSSAFLKVNLQLNVINPFLWFFVRMQRHL